jgi:hypothetical protein
MGGRSICVSDKKREREREEEEEKKKKKKTTEKVIKNGREE